MRLSRPCYDKYHRCPGWIGPGLKSTRDPTCDNGRIAIDYDDGWWMWKFQRCNVCDIVVLPFHAQKLAPSVWALNVRRFKDRVVFWVQQMKRERKYYADRGEELTLMEWWEVAVDVWR